MKKIEVLGKSIFELNPRRQLEKKGTRWRKPRERDVNPRLTTAVWVSVTG